MWMAIIVSIVAGSTAFILNLNPTTNDSSNVIVKSYELKPVVTDVTPIESIGTMESRTVNPETGVSNIVLDDSNNVSDIPQFIMPAFGQEGAVASSPRLSGPSQSIGSNQIQVTYTEWLIPSSNPDPHAIAVNGTSSLFFTEFSTNEVGVLKIATNQFTEWGILTASSQPVGIGRATNTIAFFTEFNANKVGRLVPATNVFAEWIIPSPPTGGSPNPHYITIDSSGNLSFTMSGTDRIGRLT
jgi:streptogramin lyase